MLHDLLINELISIMYVDYIIHLSDSRREAFDNVGCAGLAQPVGIKVIDTPSFINHYPVNHNKDASDITSGATHFLVCHLFRFYIHFKTFKFWIHVSLSKDYNIFSLSFLSTIFQVWSFPQSQALFIFLLHASISC